MKEQILLLRAEGKTYSQIQKILNCSKGTIAFHCGVGQKAKYYSRRKQAGISFRLQLRLDSGGKCSSCGYDKHPEILEFHHTNPQEKEGDVSQLLMSNGFKAARKEAEKCILLCPNCHRILHFKEQLNLVKREGI